MLFCSLLIMVDVLMFRLMLRLIMVNVIGKVKLIVVSCLVFSKLIKKVFINLKFIIMIMFRIIGMVMCFNVELILFLIKLDVLLVEVFLFMSFFSVIGFKCSVKFIIYVLGFIVFGSSILILLILRIKEYKFKGCIFNKLW